MSEEYQEQLHGKSKYPDFPSPPRPSPPSQLFQPHQLLIFNRRPTSISSYPFIG